MTRSLACLLALLVAVGLTTAGVDDAGRASPVASPTVRVRTGSGSLPAGCSALEVAQLLTRFLDAFDRGDQEALAGFFPKAVGHRDAENPGFQWYSVTDGAAHFVARDPDDLPAYFAARHDRKERLQLLALEASTSWHAGVDIAFDLHRQADDVAAGVVGGKGAIDCQAHQIIAWSMGDHAVLATPEPPTASPSAKWTNA